MNDIERTRYFTEEFKNHELGKLKKKRQIMDKLVAKEIKKNKVGSFVQKCTPKKKITLN